MTLPNQTDNISLEFRTDLLTLTLFSRILKVSQTISRVYLSRITASSTKKECSSSEIQVMILMDLLGFVCAWAIK